MVSHGGQDHLRTVAARVSLRMRPTRGFQPGRGERAEEERGSGQSFRLLPRHAPAAASRGHENVSFKVEDLWKAFMRSRVAPASETRSEKN